MAALSFLPATWGRSRSRAALRESNTTIELGPAPLQPHGAARPPSPPNHPRGSAPSSWKRSLGREREMMGCGGGGTGGAIGGLGGYLNLWGGYAGAMGGCGGSMGLYGGSMGLYQGSMERYGVLKGSMGSMGVLWGCMGFYGGFMGLCGILWGFHRAL